MINPILASLEYKNLYSYLPKFEIDFEMSLKDFIIKSNYN